MKTILTVALVCLLSPALAGRAVTARGAGAAQTGAQAGARIEGVVLDQRGGPVRGASVALRTGADVVAETVSDAGGRFAFEDVRAAAGALVVRAPGFAPAERVWGARASEPVQLEIVLGPAPLAERVTVTATRTDARLGETAASVVVVSAAQLEETPALTLDDALRQVPGFQLFRRSGSRTANPTAQGVSLRGVGPSGASRALVLVDAIPLNDPFGGWVYWGRVPRESISRVEVLRGGASSLYGSAALGGVVQFVTRRPGPDALSLETSYGNQATGHGSLYASGRRGPWGAALAAEAFRTEGHVLVGEAERGRADTPAGTRHASLELTVERGLKGGARLFARGSYFGEARRNGTPLQTNSTRVRQVTAGADWQDERAGAFTLRAYASAQTYDQSFSAVAADRESETLTRLQRVPARAAGAGAQWSRAFGQSHALLLGFDARGVRGASDEIGFNAGRAASLSGAGGRERTLGLFAQETARLTPRLILTAGARFDRWRNYAARSTTRSLARPGAVVTAFDDRTESAFSPHLSALFRAGENFSLTASAYRAFRAPTLNELYRGFRVGNVVTLANEELRAERLTGGEAGFLYAPRRRALSLRGNLFYSTLARPIANVTLAAAPGVITRQRRNLGRTRSAGLELEAEARLGEKWNVSGGYLLTDARVSEFAAQPALEGLRVPQVARHLLTFQARYSDPRLVSLALQARASGRQFEDDLNLLPLGRYFALDVRAARRVGRGTEVFAAAENLTGRRNEVGRTPVVTLGPRALARFGLRVRLGAP
jgi:outer membrane receptor protein involved in Fe transport